MLRHLGAVRLPRVAPIGTIMKANSRRIELDQSNRLREDQIWLKFQFPKGEYAATTRPVGLCSKLHVREDLMAESALNF